MQFCYNFIMFRKELKDIIVVLSKRRRYYIMGSLTESENVTLVSEWRQFHSVESESQYAVSLFWVKLERTSLYQVKSNRLSL